jgi:ArsR family transcriptional regulator
MTTALARGAPAAADRARAARLFHALSDETRLAILDLLHDGEHCVCDLQDALDAAQSRLSFHLKVLREAGLVTDRKEGRWSYYALVPETLAEVHDLVVGLDPGARRVAGGKGRAGRSAPLRVVGNCCG